MEGDSDVQPNNYDSNASSQDKKAPSKQDSSRRSTERNLSSSVHQSVRQAHSSLQTLTSHPNDDVLQCRNRRLSKSTNYAECAKCGKISGCSQVVSPEHNPKLDPALETSQTSTCHTKIENKVSAKLKKLRALREKKAPHKPDNKGHCKHECKGAIKKDQIGCGKPQTRERSNVAAKAEEAQEPLPNKQLTASPYSSDEDQIEEAGNPVSPTDSSNDDNVSLDEEQKNNALALCAQMKLHEPSVTLKMVMPSGFKKESGEEYSTDDHMVLTEEFLQKCNLQDMHSRISQSSVTMENVFYPSHQIGVDTGDDGANGSDNSKNVDYPANVANMGDADSSNQELAVESAEEPVEDRYLRYQRMQIVTHLQAVHMIYSEIRKDKRMKYLEQIMINKLG